MNILARLMAIFFPKLPLSTHEVMPEEHNIHSDIEEQEHLMHPKGKGVFVQTVLRATRGGTPETCAAFAEHLGLEWAMLLCIWQHDDRDRIYDRDGDEDSLIDVHEAAIELREKGIDPWLWGWPHPDRIEAFVEYMCRMYRETRAVGIVLNVEAPFYGRRLGKPRHEAKARVLMSKLRAELGEDVPIGLSSYGARFWHKSSFPWEAFAESCNFGMPQIYDSNHNDGPTYPQKCWDSWRELFDIIVPTWGASKAHTAQQMRDAISRTPLAPAVSWWDMNHLRYSEARRGVVREVDMKGGE